jgi:putative beta-lysine N-acetyltransferase
MCRRARPCKNGMKISILRLKKKASKSKCSLNDNLTLRICDEADVITIADIYKNTFQSYPFPIDDPAYVLNTIKSHIDYFRIEYNSRLVAVSSADMDKQSSNAEMTDFATLPEWQVNGLAQCLLLEMENAMKNKGIKTAYIIAGGVSAGMNITFRKVGYKFGGRLKDNTNISGKIEFLFIYFTASVSFFDYLYWALLFFHSFG